MRGFGHLALERKIDPLQLFLEGIGFFDAGMRRWRARHSREVSL
jgi:hypothetical protein